MAALLACACRPYVLSSSAVDRFPKADQEIDFLGEVQGMNAVTNNDALHAFFLLQDGQDPHPDYAARRREAQRRGWMRRDASELPNAAAKVGWMATAGCVVMQVKGGLSMALLGPTARYATRELVYMEILPLRTENQILSGGEFVDYINRLDRIAGGSRAPRPADPLEGPAGDTAASPGNEGAIQEGPLPEQGPREAPVPGMPPTVPEVPPTAQPPESPAPAPPEPSEPAAPEPQPVPAFIRAQARAADAAGLPAGHPTSDRHVNLVANAISDRILGGTVAQSHRAQPAGSSQERASA